MCGVPFNGDGPKLFAVYDDHCYVKKLPETTAEVATMLETIRVAELKCIQYAGVDSAILAALESAGELVIDQKTETTLPRASAALAPTKLQRSRVGQW